MLVTPGEAPGSQPRMLSDQGLGSLLLGHVIAEGTKRIMVSRFVAQTNGDAVPD